MRRNSSAKTPTSGMLDSWKEIAVYLKRDVRTAQRWEQSEGLPIHRHIHRKTGSVYAYKNEIDLWWKNDHITDGGIAA